VPTFYTLIARPDAKPKRAARFAGDVRPVEGGQPAE